MTALADPVLDPTRPPVPKHSPLVRFFRGKVGDANWVRPALLALLALTAVLYLWSLGGSGWANSFYSAAVQAGSVSWEAFFFGSSDAANSITVDKAPGALWVMELSARIFGLNSWSILVPQALEGVAAVGVLYAAVRRVATPGAGLLAGAALALTPVAVLMFRFNNPDALLVLLLVCAAYATTRALENAAMTWLALAGAAVGFAFLAKELQAFLVLPALAVVYLVAAPTTLWRRVRHVLVAGAAMIAAGGWWVLIVTLVPASARPFIGGSQTNSALELVFGYNGFGRLTGNEAGGLGNTNRDAGWTRLFGSMMGSQISWLLPAALILFAAGLWVTRRAPRTDRTRAALLLWGGWLLVTGLVFSLSQGIIHPYYTVALAPAIGAGVGIGGALLWRRRAGFAYAAVLAATIGVTAIWGYELLSADPSWLPWLRIVVLVGGLIAAGLLLVVARLGRVALAAVAGMALAAGIAGPAAYAVDTAGTPHSGAIPTAGPVGGFDHGGPGPGGRGGGNGMPGGGNGNFGGRGNGGFGGPGGNNGMPGGGNGTGPGGPNSRGGMGGMRGGLNGTTPSAALTALLEKDASSYTWVAATVGSDNASGYQLATGDPVMAVGGFNGTDPSPTLAQFQQYVREHKIHYFVGDGSVGFPGRGSSSGSTISRQIAQWVGQNFTSSTVGGVTVYDLTKAITSS
jgi:4-amino-4-deoxy-L-arabinose transferase-like glycosyltransferase